MQQSSVVNQRIEEALRLTEERFRLLVESVRDYAIFMVDPNGIVVTWNVGAERIKGYKAEEIIGQSFAKFYPPEEVAAAKLERELDIARREGRYEEDGWRIRKNGSRFWAHVVLTALRGSSGEIVGFAKVTQDLTERVKAEQQRASLAQSEHTASLLGRLLTLAGALAAAQTPQDVAEVAVVAGLEALGARAAAFFRIDGDEMELVAAKDLEPELAEKWRRFSVSTDTLVNIAHRTREVHFAEAPSAGDVALPLVIGGEVLAVVWYRLDPRHLPEDERALLRTLAAQIGQALRLATKQTEDDARRTFLADATTALAESLDYQVTLAKAARLAVPRLADWCAVDIIVPDSPLPKRLAVAHVDPAKVKYAHELDARYPPDPNAATGVPNVMRTGKSRALPGHPGRAPRRVHERRRAASRRARARSALGDDRPARVARPHARRDHVRHGRVGSRATTRKTSRSRRSSRAGARHRDRERASSIAPSSVRASEPTSRTARRTSSSPIVSHELRTPLNAILGWAKLMNARDFDAERRARAVETIERNAVAMAQLIEDLLDVSRIVSGKMRIDARPISLEVVIAAALDSIKPAADAKGIQIATRVHGAIAPVLGDAARLQQVVWNLLSQRGEIHARRAATWSVTAQTSSDAVVVRVKDDGAGIAPHFVPYVFDPFSQADARITRARGGLGLGLAITKQLVELHGGHIDVASEGEGRGATFTLTLPLRARPDDEPRTAPTPRTSTPSLRGLRVLVLDDERDARELVQAILVDRGCEVTLAPSVDEALGRLDAQRFDVVLADISMPHRDGYDFIRELRSRSKERGGRSPRCRSHRVRAGRGQGAHARGGLLDARAEADRSDGARGRGGVAHPVSLDSRPAVPRARVG